MEMIDNPFLAKLFHAFETKKHFAFVIECTFIIKQIAQEDNCFTDSKK